MSDDFELEILATMPNYYGWIMETFAPFVRGHVVEYGTGTGTISLRLASLADKLTWSSSRRTWRQFCGPSFATIPKSRRSIRPWSSMSSNG